jgi:penicillin-binding protein 2
MISRRKKRSAKELAPDEIFQDSVNIHNFNEARLEGRIEQPISKYVASIFGGIFIILLTILILQVADLQIHQGDGYFARGEDNRTREIPLFGERGVIYDRDNKELAWNEKASSEEEFAKRKYIEEGGYGFLGFIRYPQKDDRGYYWRDSLFGETGIEKLLNSQLAGSDGVRIVEVDVLGEPLDEGVVVEPKNGENVVLTLDAVAQSQLYEAISNHAEEYGYQGGAGVLMDIHSGEVISLVSYPDVDPNVLMKGDQSELIQEYFNDPRKPFLNRAISGLYVPGSTIKPILGLAGLEEGIINKDTRITSTGYIEIESPYDDEVVWRYRDWREGGHGRVDIKRAIADSVNTFFYVMGGGYKDRVGLGIDAIDTYMALFGLGQKTGIELEAEQEGVVPNPEWKQKVFKDIWRLGDTYISSIGQFGFQVTPIQMARAMGAIASKGNLVQPHITNVGIVTKRDISIEDPYYDLIQEGMRDTVLEGTAYPLNVRYLKVAAKTGTAQVGVNREYINSWIVGYFPYEDPQYSFAIVMEKGDKEESPAASWAMRNFLDSLKELEDDIVISNIDKEI